MCCLKPNLGFLLQCFACYSSDESNHAEKNWPGNATHSGYMKLPREEKTTVDTNSSTTTRTNLHQINSRRSNTSKDIPWTSTFLCRLDLQDCGDCFRHETAATRRNGFYQYITTKITAQPRPGTVAIAVAADTPSREPRTSQGCESLSPLNLNPVVAPRSLYEAMMMSVPVDGTDGDDEDEAESSESGMSTPDEDSGEDGMMTLTESLELN